MWLALFDPYDRTKAKSLLQAAGASGATLRLRLPTLPYATSCGQVVKSQLEQVGLKVRIDQLEFPAAWLTTVFTNADYDLSIIAHVEPRDLGAVFNSKYYTRYDDPQLRRSETLAAWLFLLPSLVVADKNITGLATNAITESFDLTRLVRS